MKKLIILILLTVFFAGESNANQTDNLYKKLDLFSDVLETLNNEYVDQEDCFSHGKCIGECIDTLLDTDEIPLLDSLITTSKCGVSPLITAPRVIKTSYRPVLAKDCATRGSSRDPGTQAISN